MVARWTNQHCSTLKSNGKNAGKCGCNNARNCSGKIAGKTAGKPQENARLSFDLYFLLNGWDNEVQYAKYEEENIDDSPQISVNQISNRNES